MKLVVCKNYLGAQMLYRSLDPLKKTASEIVYAGGPASMKLNDEIWKNIILILFPFWSIRT